MLYHYQDTKLSFRFIGTRIIIYSREHLKVGNIGNRLFTQDWIVRPNVTPIGLQGCRPRLGRRRVSTV